MIGGGAAGLFCAVQAGKRGRRVAVIEHTERPGKKILISGGGRCNFTNLECGSANFLSANPHFAKSALARYTPRDFLALVERYGIAWHEKTRGQLFCDGSAREITGMLERECAAAGVKIFVSTRIQGVRRAEGFVVETDRGEFEAGALVVATGGLSIPKIGATDLGYRIAEQFGLNVIEPEPALVPVTFGPEDAARYADLAGVAFDARTSCDGQSFDERALFTHRGLSGPAILQISSYWKAGEEISIDLMPGGNFESELLAAKSASEKATPATLAGRALPKRLAARWFEGEALRPVAGYSNAELAGIARRLHGWRVAAAGTEGFAKAEVTRGGVDTRELSSKTMEARKVPGLYFIGEVVDVTGQLGGFNFQWAWASGYCAGQVC